MEFYDGTYGRSFKNYMSTISDGQFIIQNVFPQWDDASKTVDALELPFKKSEAESGNIDYSIVKYVAENSSLPEDAVVDYDNDGLIDNLTIILQGGTTYDYASTMPSLYPHQSSYPGASSLGGKRISAYNMLNTERLLDSSLADQSGLICHEFLHTLGYPDLYTRDGSLPVYSWDIMGQSSKYLTRPLAYLRMAFSGWVDLPTLTESQASVSLKVNEAVIIKSPLNPYEVFVVERREKTSSLDSNSIDAVIGGSGLIVYRVDTTVEGLSNYFGKTGVYIFRPQAGQNGYVEGNERLTLSNAFLSQEANRTSIGSGDPADQLTDGALTFSDGSNSGIKIADVSSAQGESMTFSVTIPDASQYDLWEDTNFPGHTYTALANIDGKQMAVGYDSGATKLQLYQYENETWIAQGSAMQDNVGINSDVKLFSINGSPAVAYTDRYGTFKLQKYTAGGWSAIGSPIADVNSFDVQESTNGQSAHLCYIANRYSSAYYASVTETAVSSPIQYANGFLGNAKVVVTDDTVYAAARNVSGNAVLIYPLNEAGTGFDAAIASPGNASAYDLMAYNNVLYFAMGTTSQLQLKKYNGSAWEEYAQLAIDSFTPKLAVAQGNLYVLTVPAEQSATDGLRVYSVANGQLQSEGEIVDRNGSNYFLMASQDNLFVGYTVDYNKAMVKKKTTANPLVSLTITPPDKTTYLKGDPVSTVGLKVVANYANSQRELEPTEYTISGFDTATAGERLATISFGGKENTFAYTVLEETEPQPTVIDEVTVNGLEAPEAGKTPDTNATVAETGTVIQDIIWEGKLANGKFTYNQAYTAKITLKAQDGYVFASSVTATLNGKAVQAVVNTDGTLTLTQTYLPLEAPGIIAKPVELELEVGESAVITVEEDPTGSALTWESKDSDIASVDQNGNVTAVAEGSTQITVTNEYGKSAVVKVTVTKKTEPQPTVIDKVTVNGLEAPEAGKTPDTNATMTETGAAIQDVTWEGKLANGKFTYNQAYTAKITLKAEDGYVFASSVTATLNGKAVQAVVNADGTLTLTQTYLSLEAPGIIAKPVELELEVGESAVITVEDPTGSALTWESAGDTIATVDQKGNVIAVAEGSTQITVTNEYGKSAVVKVTVTKKAEPQPTVIDKVTVSGLEAPEAGKTPDTNAAVAGTGAAIQSITWEGKLANGKFTYNQAYTAKITLKAEDGYVFANSVTATLNGKAVQAVVNADGTLTLTQTYLPLEAPGIIAKPANLELEVGESAVITVDDPTGSTLTWESADGTIASVDQKGNVTAVAEGSTRITVTNEYGKSAVVKVTVTKTEEPQPTAIDKVNVNGLEAPEAGTTPDTNATVAETGAAIQYIIWEGKLTNGKFTYNQAYTAKITLKAEDGYVFASSVTATLNGKTVQAVVNADGTLTLTQTYLPLEAPGITAKPVELELEVGESAVITVEDPTGSALTWESADDTIATVDQNGNVTAVAEGSTQITVTNEYGSYSIISVTVKADEDIGGGEDSDSSDNSDSSDTSDSSESSDSDSSTSSDTDSSVGGEQSGTSSETDENTSHSSNQPVETGAKGGTPWAPIMLTIASGIVIVVAAWKKKRYYSA